MRIEELDLDSAKEIIIKWAKDKPFITKVYLFGSRVTGVSKKTDRPVRADSDLDIAIEFNAISKEEDTFTTWISEGENWRKELLCLLGFSKKEHLSLDWYHPKETPNINQYIKDGSILIYFSEEEAH